MKRLVLESAWVRAALLGGLAVVGLWFALPSSAQLKLAYYGAPPLIAAAVVGAAVLWVSFNRRYAAYAGLATFVLVGALVAIGPMLPA